MADILHKIEIEAPTSKVYDALSTERGLASWWTRDALATPEVGSVAEFFGILKMKVTTLEQDKKVEWRCLEGPPDWVGTDLVFRLEATNEGTSVRFAHRGW